MFSFKLFLLKHIWKQRKTIKNLVNTIEEQQVTIDELNNRINGYKKLLWGDN